jgi:CYTH domain-containing protein
MDGAAYTESFESFQALARSLGKGIAEICEQRYLAVLHLQTAALGAEKFYTLENNSARKESPDDARRIDERTLDVWRRHPHHRLIDNSTDFAGKALRFEQEIAVAVGDPLPHEIERKFLVERPDSLPVKFVESRITQHYLVPKEDGQTRRVRERLCGGEATYTYTEKCQVGIGVNTEKERIINERTYRELLEFKIPGLNPVKKTRKCFFFSGKFFELDEFDPPVLGCLLEIELSQLLEEFAWPPFIKLIREVTGDSAWSNRAIAERFSIRAS